MGYSFPWLRKQWWAGLRKLKHVDLYHVSSLDDLALGEVDFSKSYAENLSPGLPAYLNKPSKQLLRPDDCLYRLRIENALALKVASKVVDDELYTSYDVEVMGQLSRWGLPAVAHPRNVESLLEKYEPRLHINVVLHSHYLAIVRDVRVIESFEKVE